MLAFQRFVGRGDTGGSSRTRTGVFTNETYQQYWQDFRASGRMFDYALAWQGLADRLIFAGDRPQLTNPFLLNGQRGGMI